MKCFWFQASMACLLLVSEVCIGQDAPGCADAEAVQQSIDTERLREIEELAKAWLDFMVKIQSPSGALPRNVTVEPGTGEVVSSAREVRNDDLCQSLGKDFLWGYRIWRDERYLRAAVRLADFFVKAQHPQGGWAGFYSLQPDGSFTTAEPGGLVRFEEYVQSNCVRHLAAVYYLTGDEKYKRAAMKGGEVILYAQDPSGWWPFAAVSGAGGDPREGYMKGPTLNDWALNACVGDCLVLYHMTGDRRYLDAICKAGEWLISAQLEDPTPGWADQYDLQGNPAWARPMEPPAVGLYFGTDGAEVLLMLYDVTGNERYLQPLRKHLAWLQSIPKEKKGWIWYAHRSWSAEENRGRVTDYSREMAERYGAKLPSEQTLAGVAIEAGEPIVAHHYQMVPVDHPEVQRYLKPLNGHYVSRAPGVENWLARELQQRSEGPIMPSFRGSVPARLFFSDRARARPTPAGCTALYDPDGSLARNVSLLEPWRSGQPDVAPSGMRPLRVAEGGTHRVPVDYGSQVMSMVLRQIALANVALRRASAGIIPLYTYSLYECGDISIVDPTCDWYAVDLDRRKEQQ
ncbi:MAG TPA: hypothetical protein HPP83_02270 [Candidatus Hydrogenedentes bacterium]|nr:hypothetical protein [Candidatus Hydrogenedentota bacterium]